MTDENLLNYIVLTDHPIKVFVSLPMRGHTDEEIRARQNEIFERLSSIRPGKCILTFSLWQEQPPSPENQVWYLGKSIQALGDSDVAIFACNWATARGCIVERAVCDIYKIPIIDESDLINYY
jgi:hypothetical protein